MEQWEQVFSAMEKNGGFATFNELYKLIDFSNWGTKTPRATVRQIVQLHDEFFKIKPGLWGLKKYEDEVRNIIGINRNNTFKNKETQHSYYQGVLVTIGNIRNMKTYILSQDNNKLYLSKPLKNISSIGNIYEFAYSKSIYNDIKNRINFISYEDIDKQFEYDKKQIAYF